MSHPITRREPSLVVMLLALFLLGGLSACAQPAVNAVSPSPTPAPPTMTPAATPTVTPTVPGTPPGWSIYRGAHFTIAYPDGWSATTSTDGMGQSVATIIGPQPRDQITIIETDNVPHDQVASLCRGPGATQARLAGLPMRYQVTEGVHRVWDFVTSADTDYGINTFDADQPAATQAQGNAILATFRPDDTTSGCP